MKHTTGPWYISKRNPRLVIESGPRGNSIAKTGVNLGVCSQEQAEANAKLIAESPELLAQLKTMVAAFLTYAPKTEGAEYRCVLDARALIAKIEGGAI